MKASDFYFRISRADEADYIDIIHKKTWDQEGYVNDEYSEETNDLMEPLGFSELMECCYEPKDGLMEKEAYMILKNAGFEFLEDKDDVQI